MPIDTNVLIREMLEISTRLVQSDCVDGDIDGLDYQTQVDRLADLVLVLDERILQGDALPTRWTMSDRLEQRATIAVGDALAAFGRSIFA